MVDALLDGCSGLECFEGLAVREGFLGFSTPSLVGS